MAQLNNQGLCGNAGCTDCLLHSAHLQFLGILLVSFWCGVVSCWLKDWRHLNLRIHCNSSHSQSTWSFFNFLWLNKSIWWQGCLLACRFLGVTPADQWRCQTYWWGPGSWREKIKNWLKSKSESIDHDGKLDTSGFTYSAPQAHIWLEATDHLAWVNV